MILPKVRDPRLVTIRRGGTVTDSDHHLLALWAAECAEHVLHLFESAAGRGGVVRVMSSMVSAGTCLHADGGTSASQALVREKGQPFRASDHVVVSENGDAEPRQRLPSTRQYSRLKNSEVTDVANGMERQVSWPVRRGGRGSQPATAMSVSVKTAKAL